MSTCRPPTGAALILGTVTTDAISAAGQQDSYVFTLTDTTQLVSTA